MKLLNLITFPLVFILLSCGGEKTKEEKKEPYINGLALFKEKNKDFPTFKKKYEGKEVKLDNIFIGNALEKDGERILQLYAYDKSLEFDGKSLEQSKSHNMELNNIDPSNRDFTNPNRYYAQIGGKVHPVVYLGKAKLSNPEQFVKNDYKDRLYSSNILPSSQKGIKEYIFGDGYNDYCLTFTNPIFCKVSGKLGIDKKEKFNKLEGAKEGITTISQIINIDNAEIEILSDINNNQSTVKTEKSSATKEVNEKPAKAVGTYKGDFGKYTINLQIESISDNNEVTGNSIVFAKGTSNKLASRPFSGKIEGSKVVVKEPGDDPNDGTFEFDLVDDNQIQGIWKSYKGNIKISYLLNK